MLRSGPPGIDDGKKSCSSKLKSLGYDFEKVVEREAKGPGIYSAIGPRLNGECLW
jgi:hypothetical protein